MPSYLEITALGHAGRDAEMRYTPSGQPVTSFSIATSRSWKSKSGEWEKETIWLKVSVWGDAAERASKILKGDLVEIRNARLTGDSDGNPRMWEDKSGNKKASFEVTAQMVINFGRVKAETEVLPPQADQVFDDGHF